jgi:prepilin-type N-terminal cleavage/methylation domain-containing protein
MRRRIHTGFTLVELLVVITIIAMLMGIVFPAANQVIETMRRTTCLNNMRETARGVDAYVTSTGRYPGLVDRIRIQSTRPSPPEVFSTWVIDILEFIQKGDLHESWELETGTRNVDNISTLICPSDSPEGDDFQKLSVVANGGKDTDWISDKANKHNGVFANRLAHPEMRVKLADIAQTNYTLLLSENVQARNWADKRERAARPRPDDAYTVEEAMAWTSFVWNASRSLPWNRDVHNPLYQSYGPGDRSRGRTFARPSSKHSGGANAVFCNQNAKFITDSI